MRKCSRLRLRGDEMILKGRLNGVQRNKLKGLYDMPYTPAELANELGINKNQVYMVYIPLGCPVIRENRRIFINGKAFYDWYIKTYPKLRLLEDETFCKTCKQAVKIKNPQRKTKNGLVYVLSKCPACGRGLTKIIQYKGH